MTYGAGGSTRERTHATVKRILAETALTPAAHLTCVAATRAEIDEVIRGYRDAGVRHIVALRGDPIGGVGEKYAPHPGGYENGADLVAGIKRIAPTSKCRSRPIRRSIRIRRRSRPTSTCSRPRSTPARPARSRSSSSRTICYFRYLDRVRARGIDIPIVPGILPVQNFKQTKNFAARCGASVPDWLAERFDGLDDDVATRKLIAAAVAAEQVLDLVDRGVTDFHFYTMNRADLVYAICHLLGLRPRSRRRTMSVERAAGRLPLPMGERGGVRGLEPLEGSRVWRQQPAVARRLRRHQTDAERMLVVPTARSPTWRMEIPPADVDRCDYIVDFCCPDAKLVIELDGGQHADQQASRCAPNEELWKRAAISSCASGTTMCCRIIDGVLEEIFEHDKPTDDRTPSPHPSPLRGEGADLSSRLCQCQNRPYRAELSAASPPSASWCSTAPWAP